MEPDENFVLSFTSGLSTLSHILYLCAEVPLLYVTLLLAWRLSSWATIHHPSLKEGQVGEQLKRD